MTTAGGVQQHLGMFLAPDKVCAQGNKKWYLLDL